MKNTLIVVGAGIKFLSHLTIEAKSSIEKSDKVFYLVNEPAMKIWIRDKNPQSESLDFLYDTSNTRNENYLAIAEYVNKSLNETKTVCLVMYGHPTYLADPSMYSVNLAKKNGHKAYVLPGISSEDCLFADLLIDPSSSGSQSYEATDYLLYDRESDSSSHLIIWQASMIGIQDNFKNQNPSGGLKILTDRLLSQYSERHPVILYEAAQYPACKPRMDETALIDLPDAKIHPVTTLYIPPNKIKMLNEARVKQLDELRR